MGLHKKSLQIKKKKKRSTDNLANTFPKWERYKKSNLIGLQCVMGHMENSNRIEKDRKQQKWTRSH